MDLTKLKPISDADVSGKRVLVRADLNVPVADGKVTDATRLERILAGLKDLSARNARVIVISHFGRPKGAPDPTMSLAPVAAKLGELLGKPVQFVNACIGADAEDAVSRLAPGEYRRSRKPALPQGRGKERSGVRHRAGALAAMCSSTTRSPPRIGRTPRPRASRACCRPTPVR